MSSEQNTPAGSSQPLTGMLSLIGKLNGLAELTPERIGESMNLNMTQAKDGTHRFGAGGALNSDWNYGVTLDKALAGNPRLEFSFNPNNPGAKLSPICQPDYEEFAQSLQSLGFKREPYRAEHGRLIKEFFDKPGLRVSVYPEGEGNDSAARTCVRMITIP